MHRSGTKMFGWFVGALLLVTSSSSVYANGGIDKRPYETIMKCDVDMQRPPTSPAGHTFTITEVNAGSESALSASKGGVVMSMGKLGKLEVKGARIDTSGKLWLTLEGHSSPVAAPRGVYQIRMASKSGAATLDVHVTKASKAVAPICKKSAKSCGWTGNVSAALGLTKKPK